MDDRHMMTADDLIAMNVRACVAAVRAQVYASDAPMSVEDLRALLIVTAAIAWNLGRYALDCDTVH